MTISSLSHLVCCRDSSLIEPNDSHNDDSHFQYSIQIFADDSVSENRTIATIDTTTDLRL